MCFRRHRRRAAASPVPPRPAPVANPGGPQQPFIRFLDEPEPRPAFVAAPSPPPPPPVAPGKRKREFPIGTIAFLTVVGVGLAMHKAGAWNRERIGIADEVAKSIAVSANPTIVVDTFNGPIEVSRGSFGRVDCIVTRQGAGPDETTAERDLQNVGVAILHDGENTVNITAQRLRPESGVQAAVRLRVPEGAILALRTRHGAISVRGTDGPVTARTQRGAIRVEDAGGPLLLTTADGPISCEADEAVVSAETGHGPIRFRGTLAPGRSTLRAEHGDVTVHLPESQGFRLDARVDHGKIDSGFPLRDQDERRHHLSGVAGDDPRSTLKIRANHGDARIMEED